MKFYTADRKNVLFENQIIELQKFNDINPILLQEHANKMFPNGFSKHGDRYFVTSGTNDTSPLSVNGMLELIFEYVRAAYYPERPSRFQSFFACESVNDVERFIQKINWTGSYSIYEVECNTYFKADMNLLRVPNSNLILSKMAHHYWEGRPVTELDSNADSIWEYLLTSPIRVVKKV